MRRRPIEDTSLSKSKACVVLRPLLPKKKKENKKKEKKKEEQARFELETSIAAQRSWLNVSHTSEEQKGKNESHSPVTPESIGSTVKMRQENRPVNNLLSGHFSLKLLCCGDLVFVNHLSHQGLYTKSVPKT